MTFKLGQKVTWTSQANGGVKVKTGEVVQVVPPRGKLMYEHGDYGLHSSGLARNHESYVVHVPGKTERSKGTRYWPVVSLLKAAKG